MMLIQNDAYLVNAIMRPTRRCPTVSAAAPATPTPTSVSVLPVPPVPSNRRLPPGRLAHWERQHAVYAGFSGEAHDEPVHAHSNAGAAGEGERGVEAAVWHAAMPVAGGRGGFGEEGFPVVFVNVVPDKGRFSF